jgi:uncharacterized Zn finger protein
MLAKRETAMSSIVSIQSQLLAKEETMQCVRCAGTNVPEIIVEGGARFIAMRCVHCGDVIDPIILMNRQRRKYRRMGRLRTSIYDSNQFVQVNL